jgi:GntR family transcriptional regulator / MocR family aminotransferase
VRRALAEMTDDDLRYGEPRGAQPLRAALADYLGRVRGVVATPGRFVITTGYRQSEHLVCHALAGRGAKRIALENPGHPEQKLSARRAGLEPVMIDVDDGGMRIDELERADVDAVILTPTHQSPVGVTLSGERRGALLAWLRDHDAIAIEDDYDAEFRYDRAAVGALQGLEPEHVVYAGTVSKTLVPALRIGWVALPSRLLDAVAEEKRLADRTTAQIDQHAFAHFLTSGELDRHLRRMRLRYRRRRDALIAALERRLPELEITGAAAGLHITLALPEETDAEAIVDRAAARGVAVLGCARSLLFVGYANIADAAIEPAVAALAEAVHAGH